MSFETEDVDPVTCTCSLMLLVALATLVGLAVIFARLLMGSM